MLAAMCLRQVLTASLAAIFIAVFGDEASIAQAYPSRAITVIVPFPAGGPTDAVARIVANRMHQTLGSLSSLKTSSALPAVSGSLVSHMQRRMVTRSASVPGAHRS